MCYKAYLDFLFNNVLSSNSKNAAQKVSIDDQLEQAWRRLKIGPVQSDLNIPDALATQTNLMSLGEKWSSDPVTVTSSNYCVCTWSQEWPVQDKQCS